MAQTADVTKTLDRCKEFCWKINDIYMYILVKAIKLKWKNTYHTQH